MSPEPMVTVVVPTYNRANLIRETLESILAQQFADFELVVVSDGCTDGTEAAVESYRDPRIRLIRQPNSGGPARPRNTGVQNARGKYVAFCDDDDLWMPEKLTRQVEAMEGDLDAGLCFTGGVTFGQGDFLSRRALKKGVDRNHFRTLLYGNFIANSSVMVRRSVLGEMGPFNVDEFLRGAEDYEMWVRIAYRHRLIRIEEPLIRYRVHPTNLAGNRARATLRGIYVLRSLRDKMISTPVFLPLTWQRLKYVAYAVARR
jgi:glycosyltransferase involved in cell wall biosynthesis